jgi:hypothetical protein
MAEWIKDTKVEFQRDTTFGGWAPDGMPLVLGRLWIDDNPIPGRIDLRKCRCFATHRNAEVESHRYDYLRIDRDWAWVRFSECMDFSSALRAGTPAKGEAFLYFGRGSYDGRTVIGKVAASAGVLSAAHEGREVLVSDFELLCFVP